MVVHYSQPLSCLKILFKYWNDTRRQLVFYEATSLKRNKKFYIVRLQHWFLLIERFFSDRAMLTMISSYWCHRMIKIQRSKFSSRSKYILFYLQYPLIRIKHQLVQLLFNKRLPNLLPDVKLTTEFQLFQTGRMNWKNFRLLSSMLDHRTTKHRKGYFIEVFFFCPKINSSSIFKILES